MNEQEKKLLILDFIKRQMLSVLSTVGDQKPESALVAFGETNDLELFFGTSNTARKYKYLQVNPRVSFVIGWDDKEHVTVQYEGMAQELVGSDIAKYSAAFALKNPRTAKFMTRDDQRYFLVTPTWIRYTGKEEVFDVSF